MKWAELRRLVLTHPSNASPQTLRKMRLRAGLSAVHAARLLGISVERLDAIEGGWESLPDDVANHMSDIYGAGRN